MKLGSATPDDPLSPAWTPTFAPVGRFVREVVPVVPGGRYLGTDARGHHELIQQAATDRGLTIKVIGKTTYFYDGQLAVGGMAGWVPSLVGRGAHAVLRSKDLTKQLFEAAGVPTPTGITVDPDQFDVALAHVRAAGRPLVLKPTLGGGGAGITCGITTEDGLRAAWDTATRAMRMRTNPRFVLEELVEGVDVRVFVVGRRAVAAATRLHCHVVGDGSHSITELIDEKQRWRAEHVTLFEFDMVVDTELLAQGGRTVHDVPAAGEVVVLNGMANVSVGGEGVDVTELVHPDLLELAIEATRAIPGLGLAGVDLMAPDIRSPDGAVVLEANVGANILIHHCPAYGHPRNPAGDIIDEMIATARRT